MLEDEEAARVYFYTLLAEGKWELEVELNSADHQYLELLSGPVSTKSTVTRKDRPDVMLYNTANAVEDLTIASIQLHALGATVVFEVPETKKGCDFPDYFCTWIDMGDTSNPTMPKRRWSCSWRSTRNGVSALSIFGTILRCRRSAWRTTPSTWPTEFTLRRQATSSGGRRNSKII